VSGNYGATYEGLAELRDALDKIVNGVDAKGVRYLGNVNPMSYTAKERMNGNE
jgi:hypothetical protein